MKTKTIKATFLFSMIFLLSLGVVSAITIDNIATGNTLTSTEYINTTVGLINVQNCSFSTTADGVFNIMLNTSVNQQFFNATNNTALLTEAEDTTITVLCYNDTMVGEGVGTETVSVVANIDNTNPTCSYNIDNVADSVLQFYVKHLSPIGIQTADGSSDTTDLTYSWVLYDPSKTSQDTSSSASPSFEGLDFDELGEFTLALTITDEASLSTTCTNKTIFVTSDNDDADTIAGVVSTQSTTQENNTTWIILGALGGIALLVAVSFFVINSSKK